MTAEDRARTAGARSIASLLPVDVGGAQAPAWWGMWLLIATEAALFACILFSYYYVRADALTWPPAGITLPDLRLPVVMSALLISSSLPMWWAETGAKSGNARRLVTGLAISFVLGALFFGLELYEWSQKEFGISTNVYGSLFFTITGLHGMHLLVALYMNAVVQVRAWLGHFTEKRHLAVQNTALYWHFVDVVWIFVFSTVYLSPYLY